MRFSFIALIFLLNACIPLKLRLKGDFEGGFAEELNNTESLEVDNEPQ